MDKAKHQQMCDHCYDQLQEAVMQEVLGEDEDELSEDSEPTEEGTPSAGGVITMLPTLHCYVSFLIILHPHIASYSIL